MCIRDRRNGGLLDALTDPQALPAWLPPADLAEFARAFGVSGFRGGLNYYRNLDRNWAAQAAFEGLRVEVPALYLVGERDTGLAIPGTVSYTHLDVYKRQVQLRGAVAASRDR